MSSRLDINFKYKLREHIGAENVLNCFACGACSACCPIHKIDPEYNPRKIIRMAILGLIDEILSSEYIWLCLGCHLCWERCPQNVQFTDVVYAIRNIIMVNKKRLTPSSLFAKLFVESIKRYGRIWEILLITKFFLSTLNIKHIFSFMPLGLKLFLKGKLPLLPESAQKGLKRIFNLD